MLPPSVLAPGVPRIAQTGDQERSGPLNRRSSGCTFRRARLIAVAGRSSSCRTIMCRAALSACRPWPLAECETTVRTSVVLLRAAAVVLSAFWAVVFFGLIDLSVPFDEANRQVFSAELMLDTGWG